MAVEVQPRVREGFPETLSWEYQPRRASLTDALRHYWLTALLPVLVLGGIALGAGLARTPNYSSEVKLAVGRVEASDPGSLVGFSTASQALAETYSRSLLSNQVVEPVARALNMRPKSVRDDLTAASVPQTPIFRIDAKSESPESAERMSRLAASTMVRNANRESNQNPASSQLYAEYRRAAAARERASEAVRSATASGVSGALIGAKSDLSAASVRVEALRQSYIRSLQGQGAVALLDVVQPASAASSDRTRVLELLLFIGVVAGLLVGLSLALVRENRRIARQI
jgi:uncharacterized protein involved in exopolysaccharide biosynthesis